MDPMKADEIDMRAVYVVIAVVAFTIGVVVTTIIMSSMKNEDRHEPENRLYITLSSTERELVIEYLYDDEFDWGAHRVEVCPVNGTDDWAANSTVLEAEGDLTTKYGDTIVFRDPSGWGPETGEEYLVRIIDIANNEVVREQTLTASPIPP
ncbi:MAG: hypothetical protein ACMUHB_06780 [Thermoplasmatota archaeon]